MYSTYDVRKFFGFLNHHPPFCLCHTNTTYLGTLCAFGEPPQTWSWNLQIWEIHATFQKSIMDFWKVAWISQIWRFQDHVCTPFSHPLRISCVHASLKQLGISVRLLGRILIIPLYDQFCLYRRVGRVISTQVADLKPELAVEWYQANFRWEIKTICGSKRAIK